MSFIEIENNTAIPMQQIPVLDYAGFYEEVGQQLHNEYCHCVNYYALPEQQGLRLICCIANDQTHSIGVASSIISPTDQPMIKSLTQVHTGMHIFEREIHEHYGVTFEGHPWLKPVRFPFDRVDDVSKMADYPFYGISSHELHEVGVGPIHAGIIEPGHFRFICHGEKVLHLEIHHGYQHRGIEKLMPEKQNFLSASVLAESIAGDTVVGHNTACCQALEALGGIPVTHNLQIARTVAAELERIAMHTADLSALCTDVAFQLGSAVLQGLRTIIINTFMAWCGNRFARKLIRVGYEPYPVNKDIVTVILQNLESYEKRYVEVADKMFDMPSVLARFEQTGIVSTAQTRLIGAIGMARTAGIARDIRQSHPYSFYKNMNHKPVLLHSGDVKARAKIRDLEIRQSLKYIREMLAQYSTSDCGNQAPAYKLQPGSFAIALTEGWRGEICHCAVTDHSGKLVHYKIKDASLHNWMALALAVRNNEISDFPVCNKSFNLSYCGYDL